MLVLQLRVTQTGCPCISFRSILLLLSDPLWIHFIAEMSEHKLRYFPALGLSGQREKGCCGHQPPRWPSRTLVSKICALVETPPTPNRQGGLVEYNSSGWVTKDVETSALLSLVSLVLGKIDKCFHLFS